MMGGDRRVQDENLCLVLSADQEQWLREKTGMAKGSAWVSAIFLIVAAGWLAAVAFGAVAFDEGAGCYELSADAPDYRDMVKEFKAQGVVPCQPEGEESRGFGWHDLAPWVTYFAMLVLVVSTLTLGRNLVLHRQFKGYLTDHAAFLRKYNRP